jgi:exodeoxyribonuclease-5
VKIADALYHIRKSDKWLVNEGYKRALTEDIVFLCHTNNERVNINQMVRKVNGITDTFPVPGEILVCQENDRDHGLFNGMQLTVDTVTPCDDDICYNVSFKEVPLVFTSYTKALNCESHKSLDEEIGDNLSRIRHSTRKPMLIRGETPHKFDFGYALTVHKAQGSEWKTVVLFEPNIGKTEFFRKWMYTGMTRAKEKLCVFY